MAGSADGGAGAAPRQVSRWILALAAVTFVVSIGTPLLGIRVFHGADMLLDRAPWRVTPPPATEASNPIVGDTVSTFMPLHAEVRRRFLGGDFPVWTPFPAGGLPLASVPDAGALAPLNLPYLFVPLTYAPGLAKLLELAVAMGFMFAFLRRLGLGRAPALFGGLVYSFSGFQVVWTNWPQSHVGALMPALFWAVERAIQGRRPIDAIPVSLVLAAMLLEGFPSVTGYAVVAVGVYALVRVVAGRGLSRRGRAWALGVVIGGVALGFGVTAFEVLPLADRAAQLDLGYRVQGPDSHLPPSSLATLAVPNAFGSPVGDTYAGPLNYVEIQSFVGASSLVVLAAGAAWRLPGPLARGSRSFLWAGVLVTATLLFVGGFPLDALQATDLFGLNFVGRLRALLGFLLAGLTALGLDAVLRAPPSAGRRERLRVIGVWAAAALVAGIGLWRLLTLAEASGRVPEVVAASAVPLAAAVLTALLVLASRSTRWRRLRPAAWVVPGIFAVEAALFAAPFWPRIPPDEFYPTTPAHLQLTRRLGPDRLLGAGGAMFPGTTTYYGIRSLTTNNTLPQLPAWEDLLRTVDPRAFDQSPVFPSLAPSHEVATSPVLDRLSVRIVAVPPNLPVFGHRVTLAPPWSGSVVLAPGQPIARPLRGEGPWRAALVPTEAPLDVAPGARVAAEILDAAGRTIARGEQLVFGGQPAGVIQVLLPEASCGPSCTPPLTVEVTLRGRSGRAMVARAADGRAALSMVEAPDDGLRLEVTANVAGYRRLGSLPRIRWAGRVEVVPGGADRIAMLEEGLDPGVVLLDRPGPVGAGGTAAIEVVRDAGDEIRASVVATAPGYLVVADPLQHGWEAVVDGHDAPLRSADHALVAVFVPAGRHEVVLRFGSTAWRVGLAISGASVVLLSVVWVIAILRRHGAGPGLLASEERS